MTNTAPTNPTTADSTASIEARLLALQAEYEQRIAGITQSLAKTAGSVEQWSDQSAAHQNDDAYYSLRQEAETELAQVRTALQRLQSGEYGVCTVCGAQIEAGRLTAIPQATRCLQHAH